eukprot:6265775-Prymnesium_polylepis.1
MQVHPVAIASRRYCVAQPKLTPMTPHTARLALHASHCTPCSLCAACRTRCIRGISTAGGA